MTLLEVGLQREEKRHCSAEDKDMWSKALPCANEFKLSYTAVGFSSSNWPQTMYITYKDLRHTLAKVRIHSLV